MHDAMAYKAKAAGATKNTCISCLSSVMRIAAIFNLSLSELYEG